MRHRGSLVELAVGAAALVFTAGCSTSGPSGGASSTGSPSAPGSQTSAPSGPTLTISGFAFSALSVKTGATITVTNRDPVAHTVNVNGTSVDVTVSGGGHATFTAPAKAGTYPLTCDFHHGMHGNLIVTP